MTKPDTTPAASASREKLMECAMQIVHGGLLDPKSKLPTVESVADVIERSLDFAWLCSVRDRAESVPSQQSSASRHTPEPWSMEAGAHRILFRGRIPFYSERVLLVKAGNALAGMKPEAVKDVIGLLSEIEQLLVMDAPQPPWIPGGRAKGLPERIRAALAALKKS